MTTPTNAARRCGWHRPRNGGWRKVVPDAPSAAECWGMLLSAVASLPAGDVVVLEAFRHPGRTYAAGGRRLL